MYVAVEKKNVKGNIIQKVGDEVEMQISTNERGQNVCWDPVRGRWRIYYGGMEGNGYDRRTEQYLDSRKLRRNLGGLKGGEAHHIIPGEVVQKHNDFGLNKDIFNETWNGIMLHGTMGIGANDEIYEVNPLEIEANLPYHRFDGQPHHSRYTKLIESYMNSGIPSACPQSFNVLNWLKSFAFRMWCRIYKMDRGEFIDDINDV